MRLILTFVLLLLASQRLGAAEYTFDYNATCAAAYKAYLALRPDEGDALIKRELIANPFNLAATYIADYGDCVVLLFNGDPFQLQQRKAHEEERIVRLENGSDDAPWKRLALAGVRLHWALIHMRGGENFKAAMGFRRSYLLLKENQRLFPTFAADDVLFGAEEALAGIIPDSYRWLAGILGMKGDFNTGVARIGTYLRRFPQQDAPLREEALLYDAYLRFQFGGQRRQVWEQISNNTYFPVAGNLMRLFFRGNLAISWRKADVAVATLRAAEGTPGSAAWPVFDFELGSALLLRLDEKSTGYLDRYIANNKGGLFTKDAMEQAALAAYLAGDHTRAEAYRQKILKTGSLYTDADRQAQRFASSTAWPQSSLLAARLLIDGGYPAQALQKLKSIPLSTLSTEADRLEFEFRMGRALEETGNAAAAVQAYQRAINIGKTRPEYFAARAALQMAGIYESGNQRQEAIAYYRLALSMHDHDFQASIDQQAKAGLARLKG